MTDSIFTNHKDADMDNGTTSPELALNKLESLAIRSLIAFVAHEHQVSEDMVQALIEVRFGLNDFRNMPAVDYDNAVRYLVDLEPRMAVN